MNIIWTRIPTNKRGKGNTKVETNMPSKGTPEVVQISPMLPMQNKHLQS